jgi:putative flippase GtrA
MIHPPSGLRYAAVSVGGAVADLAIAAIAIRAGAPPTVAFALGLCIAIGLTYAGHRVWSFPDSGGTGPARLALYVCANVLTYAIRLAVHALLSAAPLPGPLHAAIPLTGAYVASFLAGFAMARLVVFRPTAEGSIRC